MINTATAGQTAAVSVVTKRKLSNVVLEKRFLERVLA